MALSREDVQGIADYARIALTDEELDEMTAYMNEAVDLLEPIRQYDLDGVDPTFHPFGDLSNVMGEDIIDDSVRALPIAVALKTAGSTRDGYFRVPSFLGTDEDEGGIA